MARRLLFALPPLGGGAEVFVEIAAGLRARGFEVDILAPLASRAHEIETGVRFLYYDAPSFDPRSEDLAYLTFQVLWGWGALRELRHLEGAYDAVFVHLPWGVGKLYGRRRRRPMVGFADVCWTDYWRIFHKEEPSASPHWMNYALGRFLQADSMRSCDRVVVPSAFFRDHIIANGVGVVPHVICHGRDPARYRHDGNRAAEKARLGLPPDRLMVLAVGYEFGRKGHHHFAELALRIRSPDTFFVAVGPLADSYASWFERDPGLAGRLFVRPYVPHQQVQDYFAAADVFVFPTYFESFGLAPVEAMASGVPVVAHRAASMPEILDDGVEGFLVPVGDLDALEARVRELLSEPARRAAMGASGRERFLAQHTAERMIDEYARLFGEIG